MERKNRLCCYFCKRQKSVFPWKKKKRRCSTLIGFHRHTQQKKKQIPACTNLNVLKAISLFFKQLYLKSRNCRSGKKKSARKLEVHICVCKFLPRKLPGAKVTFMQELVLPVQRSYFFFFFYFLTLVRRFLLNSTRNSNTRSLSLWTMIFCAFSAVQGIIGLR